MCASEKQEEAASASGKRLCVCVCVCACNTAGVHTHNALVSGGYFNFFFLLDKLHFWALKMNALQLKELSQSDLYRRRKERPDSLGLNGIHTDKLR